MAFTCPLNDPSLTEPVNDAMLMEPLNGLIGYSVMPYATYRVAQPNVFQVIEGVDDPLDFQLLNSGDLVQSVNQSQILEPFNADGMTVTIVLSTSDGSAPPSVAGKVAWVDQSNAVVRYSPAPGDLKWSAGPYSFRIIVTDGAGNTTAFPRFQNPGQIQVGE